MVQYDEIVHPELFFLGTPSSVIPSASLRSGRLLFQGRKQDSFLFFSIYCKLVSLRPYSKILISGTLHEPLCHWTRFLGTARSLLQSATTEHSGGGTKAPPKPHLAVHRSFLCGGTQEPPELPLLWNRRSWCWWRSQFCYHFFRRVPAWRILPSALLALRWLRIVVPFFALYVLPWQWFEIGLFIVLRVNSL